MDQTTVTAPVDASASAPATPGQAGAPKTETPAAATTETSTAPKGATEGQVSTAGTSAPKTFDVEKSYSELRGQFTKVTQEAARDRRAYQETMRELTALRESHTKLADMLAKATKMPVDPKQFMQDLTTKGPEALNVYLQEQINAATAQIQKDATDQANRALRLESQLERMMRRMDKVRYPDFEQLEQAMNEIAESEDCPIDWTQPISVIYDALYKLARTRSSEDAVRAAEEFGRKTAEQQLGKEAATAVPGGGKAGTPVDPAQIKDINKLREFFVSQLGEAE